MQAVLPKAEEERHLVEGHLLVRDLDALLEGDGEVVRARVHRLHGRKNTNNRTEALLSDGLP